MTTIKKALLACLALTVLCLIILIKNERSIQGWLFVCFFGSMTIILFLKILFPNASFLRWIKTPREPDNRPFEEKYNDNGIFEYSENGFIINNEILHQEILWSEVKTIFGYKIDLLAIDCICVDVFCDNDKFFTINEETIGWFQFIERSKNIFTSIDKSWNIKITIPAFETNLTLIYDRENRTLDEVKKECIDILTKNGSR